MFLRLWGKNNVPEMITTYDWKCWDFFTWDLVQVHYVYLDLGLSIRQNTENVKQMEKMPPHRKTGFPEVTRCRLSRTPVALVQVAQNPCRTKMVKALTRLVAHLSQLYSAIVPSRASSSDGLNVTVLCAGAPGKPHPDPEAAIQRRLYVKFYIHCYI